MSSTRDGTMACPGGDAAGVATRCRGCYPLSLGVAAAAALPVAARAQAVPKPHAAAVSGPPVIHYRTASIDGVSLFYREAGPADAPAVLLLHGFPTSSHMFCNLIPALADRYRVIAPDYPGFGQSDIPAHTAFPYTFDRVDALVDGLLGSLGVGRYAMYVMDYGAPVGWRLALKRPERVTGLIVQNGNAYDEGLGAFWDPIKAYWADHSAERRQALNFLVAPATRRFQYTDGVRDVSRIAPTTGCRTRRCSTGRAMPTSSSTCSTTTAAMSRSIRRCRRISASTARRRWSSGAPTTRSFPAAGAHPFRRDLPDAEMHLLDTGHFALDDKLDVMAPLIRGFLDRKVAPR